MSLDPVQLFVQFLVVTAIFILCMKGFFRNLLSVLQERESKVTMSALEAEKKMHEAEGLAQSYQEKIEQLYREAQEDLKKRRGVITSREDQRYGEQTVAFSKEFELEKKKVREEILLQKKEVFKESQNLAKALTGKLSGEGLSK